MAILGSSDGKEFACSAGDWGLIPSLGRSPGEGKGYPLQYSGLENSMDCTVHMGLQRVRHGYENFTFTASWKKSHDQPSHHIKKQRHYIANKGLSSQSFGFSSSHVRI